MDNRNNGEVERNSHDSFYRRQNELAQKSITLQVLQNNLTVNKALCDERQILLEQEIKILDEIHSKVWNLQNKICNQIWDFSTRHDQNEIIRNYPDLSSELHVYCECERKSDVLFEDNIDMEKLILEIRNLESNLKSTNCESLSAELNLAERELQICDKDSPEIESLKEKIKACEERISSLRLKLGLEYKRIENTTFECLKNNVVSKSNSRNVKETSKFDDLPLLCASETNHKESKNINSLSNRFVPDQGGFVTANTYLTTADNPTSFISSTSHNKVVIGAVPNEKPSSLINHPKKTFVVKRKSNITQRR